MVRPMSGVQMRSPVNGISRMNRAIEGMVNSAPVNPRIGAYSRGQRQREGDQGADHHRQRGQLQVLQQVGADGVEVVPDPRPADQLRDRRVDHLTSSDSSSWVSSPS